MPRADRVHFDTYREQTRVKHEILQAYLPAFFDIMKGTNKNLLYIDAFAGRGAYKDENTDQEADGSPLRALKLIARSKDFSQRVSTVFVESDPVNFPPLDRAIKAFYAANPHIRKPIVLQGTFAEEVGQIVTMFSDGKDGLAPTFLFVDPCGVEGVSFDVIKDVMQFRACEAFIFFNYQGVRRTAGLKELSPVLVDLYGSHARAKALLDALNLGRNAYDREQIIVTSYRDAVREEMAAPYIVAFRVESQEKREGSHYLLHVAKHPLGFRIMKDIMWRRGRTVEGQGGLELVQASRGGRALIRPNWDGMKRRVLDVLDQGPMKAEVFYLAWAEEPDDVFSASAYRQALLELEEEGRIEVLDKACKKPYPMKPKGPRRKGTLAKDYYIRRCLPKG